MITSGEKAKALDIVKNKHFSEDHITELAQPLIKLYGKNKAYLVAKGLIEEQASEIINKSTVGFIVCEDNYRMVQESIVSLGMESDFKTRINERGCVISSYTEDIVIKFDMGNIEIQSLLGESFHPDFDIYSLDTFYSALNEVVSIDMRTKSFKNLCKRRSGDAYDKNEQKIDMRTRSYKETKVREDGRRTKSKTKMDEADPMGKIMRDNVMGEYMKESYSLESEEVGSYDDITEDLDLDIIYEEELDLAFEYFCEELDDDEFDNLMHEKLTPQQRRKKAIAFKKSKNKRKRTQEKNQKRLANKETLTKRAEKGARKAVERKLVKGLDKQEMTASQKEKLEKKLSSPRIKAKIKAISKKMLPKVKAAEKERFANMKKEKANESVDTSLVSSILKIGKGIGK